MRKATLLGGGITGVIKSMLAPDVVLQGFPRYEECKGVVADQPYPLDLYLELVEYISKKMSRQVVVKIGRTVAREIITVSLSSMKLESPSQAIAAIQRAHEQWCKPTIGEFRTLQESEGKLVVRYTAPYDCVLQEGLFYEIAVAYGGTVVTVEHADCRKRAARACLYNITYQ